MALGARIYAGGYGITSFTNRFAAAMRMGNAAAVMPAMAVAYSQLIRQATMLAYRNAFFILAVIVLLLSPLVWLMRLPSKTQVVDPEQMAAH
jgi:DHA2 family multidrug resistance protein